MLVSAGSETWDMYALGIPLLILLFFGFFKLDEVFTGGKTRKPTTRRPPPPVERPAAQMRDFEIAMQRDPDGRAWNDRHISKQ